MPLSECILKQYDEEDIISGAHRMPGTFEREAFLVDCSNPFCPEGFAIVLGTVASVGDQPGIFDVRIKQVLGTHSCSIDPNL